MIILVYSKRVSVLNNLLHSVFYSPSHGTGFTDKSQNFILRNRFHKVFDNYIDCGITLKPFIIHVRIELAAIEFD